MTPSGAASLLACKLRVAYASEGTGGRRVGSPATRLGTVCHRVLEIAARGSLGSGDDPDWPNAFEQAWQGAIAEQRAELAKLDLTRPWTAPERWPFYGPRKVAAKRIARELSREVHAPSFAAAAEDEQASADGRIRGKPDLIVRAPVREVRDYKTGSVTDEDGSVRPDYARQVQLYAVLEKDTTGIWPARGTLVPLPGKPAAVDVEPEIAARAAAQAVDALDAYNAAVAAGETAGLGSPSPTACRYCDYAPRCHAFWGAWEESWAESRLGAAAGTVDEVRKALRGGISVDMTVERGSSETGHLTVHGLDGVALPILEMLAPGDAIAFVGLKGTSPGHAVPTYQLRVGAHLAER